MSDETHPNMINLTELIADLRVEQNEDAAKLIELCVGALREIVDSADSLRGLTGLNLRQANKARAVLATIDGEVPA